MNEGNNSRFSLGALARRSASWTILGQFASQGLRLVSGIVLARLLFPEAFGLTAIVGVFFFGLTMLTDVGISQSVIQNEHGIRSNFLNTAWTMQVVRGAIIAGACVLVAWPIAKFYDEPDLFALIAAGGLGAVAQGFMSVSLHTQQRALVLGPNVRLELITQILQALVTIVWALVHPSAWALVGGTVAGSFLKTALSHRLLPSHRHRFQWDSDVTRQVVQFGKWIFLSSALTFVVTQFDKLLLAHFLDLAFLGIYAIALRLIEAVSGLQTQLTHSVLFPYFSQIARSEREELALRYYRVRLRIEVLFLPLAAFLMILGADVIDLLYDERYLQAGWILKILALQLGMSLILGIQECLLFSIGYTYYGFARSVAKAIWIVVGIPIGYKFFGVSGVIWIVAISEIPAVLVIWIAMIKHGLLRPLYELRSIGIWVGSVVAWILVSKAF